MWFKLSFVGSDVESSEILESAKVPCHVVLLCLLRAVMLPLETLCCVKPSVFCCSLFLRNLLLWYWMGMFRDKRHVVVTSGLSVDVLFCARWLGRHYNAVLY